MTKEINLFLGDSKSVEKKTNVSTSTKKEGSSLFDSILSKAKETPSKTENSDTSKTNKTQQIEAKATVSKKTTEKKEEHTAQTNNSNNKLTETSSKAVSKTETVENKKTTDKKETSLLDRLLLEAKDTLKDKKELLKTDMSENNDIEQAKKSKTAETKDSKANKKSLAETIKDVKAENKVETKENKEIQSQTIKDAKTENKAETKENKNTLGAIIKDAVNESKTEVKDQKNKSVETEEEEKTNKTDKNITAEITKNLIEENKIEKNETASTVTKKEVESVDNSTKVVTQTALEEPKENKTESKNDKKENKSDLKISDKVAVEITKEEVKENKNIPLEKKDTNSKNSTKEAVINESKEVKTELKQDSKSENGSIKTLNTIANKEENSIEAEDKKIEKTPKNLEENDKKTLKTSSESVKNEKVAEQLSKLKTETSAETVNISKENIEKKMPLENKKEKLSLLDQLVNESKNKIKEQEEGVVSKKALPENSAQSKNDILTNIYLSSRNKNIEDKSLEVGHKGKEQALNAKNVDDVKNSAKTLELGLKEAVVEIKEAKVEQASVSKGQNINHLSLANDNHTDDVDELDLKSKTISKIASKALTETIVNLNVNAQAAQTIQSRIIGARQQMSSMMSDIAREMYTNYKPPVTAFRLNLQPAHLGSIAIMIKSDRESTISISMNMSSSATLDAINENQSSLRSALMKTFGEDNNFSLDFGMQDQNPNQQDQESNENNQNTKRNVGSTEEILDVRNNTVEENPNNYM